MKFDTSTVQASCQSPLGKITMAATDKGLAGLWFERQKHLPAELRGSQAWPEIADHPVLKMASQQLTEYFAGERAAFELPLDLAGGTAFQQSVWQALLKIESGSTQSYGDISRQIGKPTAFRAVGAAIGKNPVSVIVPCHRVIGSKGALTGYAGGIDRKTHLLRLEKALPERQF